MFVYPFHPKGGDTLMDLETIIAAIIIRILLVRVVKLVLDISINIKNNRP